ncbi:GerAB/ArcD/ProY family transporter [Paenibacillus rhizovicinus]|uniref:GerAB/ArcD/ProY family transporter n=1 Tax=Paenibacillus rhizovicinus TaxID=2704463 RepID=A0A6C0NTE8_9BACL|nr:GerAB/ArcD/ProY family transporter [Paenibacillus rhizovicinus]QHW29437.1 GerAB/ArcD/ProY family transporter [Paenibacillus rhizovicinus]
MQALTLFRKTSHQESGFYALFLTNRLQMLYYMIVMPSALVQPYMLLAIVAMGVASQLCLYMLSKWFATPCSAQGYQGYERLFGKTGIKVLALASLPLLLLKISFISISYAEIMHQFVFPSMDREWHIVFPFILSCYLALFGMENMVRFVTVVFIGTIWIFFMYIPYFLLQSNSIHDLYPLIPVGPEPFAWKSLLIVFSSFSGPEFLIAISYWLNPQRKMLKYLTIANAISIGEYLFISIASLLFFGSKYLPTIKYPNVEIGRYLQSPIFERVDIILISAYMFSFLYSIALFVLMIYGASRLLVKMRTSTTRIGLIVSGCAAMAVTLTISKWFWEPGLQQDFWLDLQMWTGSATYLLVPLLVWIAIKRKTRTTS